MNKKTGNSSMGSEISRRDFLNGVGIAVGASFLPGCGSSESPIAEYYPPALTGMRGSHPGSFEVAHAAAQGASWQAKSSTEDYDLVVVGAGISGLSAAYIYRRDVDPEARILILDNHDDFGGHAKRNEFTVDGKTLIGFGGTMFMDSPAGYPSNAKQVIDELGFDTDRFDDTHNWDLYRSLGLKHATFFDKETFGGDHLATGGRIEGPDTHGAPLSDEGKKDIERLFADEQDYLAHLPEQARLETLKSHSYRDYLEQFGGFGSETLLLIQKRSHGLWSIGADALPAWMAELGGAPGFGAGRRAPGSDDKNAQNAKNFHFPDGNASVARLLVRNLIPGAAPGSTMDDIVTARFDYAALDQASQQVRLRLNSTVIDLRHQDGNLDADVSVTYVRSGDALTVTAKKVVWAGYHAVMPHICPDLSGQQSAALRNTMRSPLVYTNVLVRNWRSFQKLGFWRAYCPGSFYQSVRLDFPVSIGDYRFSSGPDDPVILHLQHIPTSPGLPAAEQFRAGRRFLLETGFDTFESHVRDQLGRLLGPGGFDADRDIAGITVNRWPHGYAYSLDAESGDIAWWPELWEHESKPWIDARQRVGNISFAGTDSASNAMTEAAIEEAYRAVRDLSGEDAA